jgi:hypothetical protein
MNALYTGFTLVLYNDSKHNILLALVDKANIKKLEKCSPTEDAPKALPTPFLCMFRVHAT